MTSIYVPQVFLTGVTGYIGGDGLYEIFNAHPDWDYTCLVRNSGKGAKVAAIYPKVKLVYGDLDSTELIEEEASKADIVYHYANCDHVPSAQAIARGLAKRQSDKPGFWIHTSGTGILTWETTQSNSFGDLTSKVYNDWDGIDELTSLPDIAIHRNVDKIVLAASKDNPEKIKTAIVCPPCIYGIGRGPDNSRSMQIYDTAKLYMQEKQALQTGKGENVWHQVHVQDLSKLYLMLGEAAAVGGLPATWDDKGYYLAENGEFIWGDIFKAVAEEAHKQGFLPSSDVKSVTLEDLKDISPSFPYLTGTTSRGVSIRAKKILGWMPKERSIHEEVPTVIEGEAKALKLIEGHAAKVEK